MADESTRQDRDKTSDQSLFVIGRMTSALESFTASFNRIEKLLDTEFKGQQTERKSYNRNKFDFDRLGKSLTGDLKENISELNDTYKKLQRSTKQLSDDWKSYSRGKEFGTSYLRSSSAEKLLNERIKELEKLNKELERTKAGQTSRVSDRHQEITQQLHDKGFDISKKYEEELKNFEKEIEKIKTSNISEIEKEIKTSSIRDKIKTLKEDTKEQQKNIDEQLRNSLQTAINEIVEELEEAVDKVNRDFSKKQEENNKVWESVQSTIDYLESSIRNADDFSNSLGQSSKSYAAWLEKRARKEETQADKMRGMISDAQKFFSSALDAIDETINELNEKLQNDLELSEDQKENIKKQIENADKQKKNIEAEYEYWKDAKPSTQILKDAGKSLTDAGKTIAANIGKSALKYIEDRYLTAYKEGFNNVYQSVETTRNSISARAKLDQGSFSDLQQDIQTQIEASGYQGTITQSDVNEALVSLSAAGVTDKTMLQTLAFEQAKMTALQSSLNLNNEETLQKSMELIQREMASGATKEEALVSLTNMFDEAMAEESLLRDQIGDAGLINNQANQILNQTMELALEQNRSLSQLSEDAATSLRYGNMAYYQGMDPNVFYSIINDLRNKPIESLGTLDKILVTGGLTENDINNMTMDQVYDAISESLLKIANMDVDDNYLASVMQAYGLSDYLDVGTIRKMRSRGITQTSLTGVGTSAEARQIAKQESDMALKQGTYISATKEYQNKAENSMAEIAISAEKLYKGNDIVSIGFNAVEEGISSLGNIGKEILATLWQNRFADGFKSLESGDMTGFLTGGTSGNTKFAGAGKALGIGAGVAVTGHSVYKNISNAKENEDALDVTADIFSDPETYSGIGAALGSAIAGPLGGAIGGVIGFASSSLGNLIEKQFIDSWNDPIEDAAKALTDAADKQIEAANREVDNIEKEIASYEDWDTRTKKEYLKNQKLANDEDLNNKTDAEINELFNEFVTQAKLNEIEKQKNIIAEQEILKKQSYGFAAANMDLEGAYGDEEAYKQLKTMSAGDIQMAMMQAGEIDENSPILSAIDETIKEMKDKNATEQEIEDYRRQALISASPVYSTYFNPSSSVSRQSYIGNVGQSGALTAFKEISEIQEMADEELKNTASMLGIEVTESDSIEDVRDAVIRHKQSNRGLTSYLAQDTEDAEYMEWLKRKAGYEKADEEFQAKWAKGNYNFDDVNSVWDYANNEIMKDVESDDAFNLRQSFASGLFKDDNGVVHLGTYTNGDWYLENYKEGRHFKTGLTSVPTDNYFATLHKGERVLTAQEAEAYNEMSSYAVSNLAESINNYGNSSNVFNTNSYGLGNFETSINNQTQSISNILNQILSAINHLSISVGGSTFYTNAGKASLLRGNSNLTQINTM